MVPAQYHDFRDVFSKEAFNELPPQKAWDHAIDLTPGTELPHSWMFPLSPAEQKELDDFLWENLVNDCIHPSKSPMGAPVFFIKKKDGSLCLIQDYWKLNEITVKNSLPLISDGDSTMCRSRKGMSGRLHSKLTKDCLSQLSCSSDCVTPLRCSR